MGKLNRFDAGTVIDVTPWWPLVRADGLPVKVLGAGISIAPW